MRIYGFPGQGSQFRGMGKELFDDFPVHVKIADDVLDYSIEELCLKDPDKKLSRTQYTQPALYVVNALALLRQKAEESSEPDFYIGHSLGEYNALLAEGAFDFETGLRLVKRRGELMSRAATGGMAAIMGIDANAVERVLAENGFTDIDIANYNGPKQVVVSGPTQSIENVESCFEKLGATYMQLNVSAAFHSRYMGFMSDEFRIELEAALPHDDGYKVISNVTAQPYEQGCLVGNLAAQICAPVRWTDSIRYLLRYGPLDFVEVGPGRVLKSLTERIVDESGGQPEEPVPGPSLEEPAGDRDDIGQEDNVIPLPSGARLGGGFSAANGRLAGKVALVTGGTSGIGAATVARFVEEGGRVAAIGRNVMAGQALEERYGPDVCFIEADVSTEDGISSAIRQAADWGGSLDILFNNAGGIAPGSVDGFTAEDFDYAVNLVLGSVLFGIKHAAPHMKRQGWGAIISNSSIAALRTHSGGYLYSVAKAAVSHATRLAGMELGRYGISVNSVSPGAVATPMYVGGSRVASHMPADKLDAIMVKLNESLAQATPLARSGSVADVAAAVAFLASDEGHFINCHDLVIDGGLIAAARGSFDLADDTDPLVAARRSIRHPS